MSITLISSLLLIPFSLLSLVLYIIYSRSSRKTEELHKELNTLREDKFFLEGQLIEVGHLQEKISSQEEALEKSTIRITELEKDLSRQIALREQEHESMAEKLNLLQESRELLKKEFELLAGKLLEEKSRKFQSDQESFFINSMKPLKDQLSEFRQRIDYVHESETKDRTKLLHEIAQLKELNNRMSEDALNLTNALKGNQKFQGNWGEFILESVLEKSGLRKGYEYEIQAKHYDKNGKLQLPDVVVHLPDQKSLVIDAKVSLLDYQKYCESDDIEEKRVFLKSHINSIEQHIKGLSAKSYDSIESINTLDFVFLFIPIEAAFLLALESHPELFQMAYDKHIVLVSPTTLLATLRTVENLWRFDRQNKNAEKIADQAGAIYDQCALVIDSLDDMGKHIDRTQEAFLLTKKRLSTGKGNLVRRVEGLRDLGAKTKRQISSELGLEHAQEKNKEE